MLKVVFVLGCLLCLTLANPMDEVLERHVRSRHSGPHGSDSNSKEQSPVNPNDQALQQLLQQLLLALLTPPQTTTPPSTTAAATTPTTTATAKAATT